jgi:hypothetical protein
MRKTTSTQAARTEMLQTGRRPEHSVASSIKRRDSIGEIGHSIAIVVVGCAFVEQIAIDIGSDH